MRLYKWQIVYSSCVDPFSVETQVVASSFSRAFDCLKDKHSRSFLDNYLLEIKFVGVL